MAKHSHGKRGMDKPVSLQSGIKLKTRDQWHARWATWVYQFAFDWLPTYCKKNIFPFKLNRTDSKHRQSSRDLMLRVICTLLYPMTQLNPFYIRNSCLSVWIIVDYLDAVSWCTSKSQVAATWVFWHKNITYCFSGTLLLSRGCIFFCIFSFLPRCFLD